MRPIDMANNNKQKKNQAADLSNEPPSATSEQHY